MERRLTDASGSEWRVMLTGRRTQYTRDELLLTFARVGSGERRYARWSPARAKAPELALNALHPVELTRLLAASQPSWTSPDGDYRSG